LAARAGRALASAELLLRAAEDLTDTAGLDQVRLRVRDVVSGDLKPSYVGLLLADGESGLHRLLDRHSPHRVEVLHENMRAGAGFPTARTLRERRMVTIPDRRHLMEEYGPEAVAVFDSPEPGSAACLPLLGARGPLGVLVLGRDIRTMST
jgi:hypothetical protein